MRKFSNDLIENVEYTLAKFHANSSLIKILSHIEILIHIEVVIVDCANIHYYIELYKIGENLAILIRTRCFDSRTNFFNKKFLIAKFYCETKQQKIFGYQGRD